MHVIITHWEHGWESFWNDGLFKVVKNKNDCRTHGYREKCSGIKRKNEREMRAKTRERKSANTSSMNVPRSPTSTRPININKIERQHK